MTMPPIRPLLLQRARVQAVASLSRMCGWWQSALPSASSIEHCEFCTTVAAPEWARLSSAGPHPSASLMSLLLVPQMQGAGREAKQRGLGELSRDVDQAATAAEPIATKRAVPNLVRYNALAALAYCSTMTDV